MNNFDQFKKDFKRDIFIKVVIDMKYGNRSRKYASGLSKKIIEVFENDSPGVVFAAINKLGEASPEIFETFINRVAEYDTRERKDRLGRIRMDLINSN